MDEDLDTLKDIIPTCLETESASMTVPEEDRAAKMTDALPKSITMPGVGMLIKVRLAPPCNTHSGISVDSVVLAQKELL